MYMDAVIIRMIDLPHGVPGVTVKDEEGDYNIYINARLSADQRVIASQHELEHIQNGDFYSEESVHDIEKKNPY